MIGIVVVSHSRRLAEAAVELACQMVQGTPPAIVIAAGLDGGVLGTDAIEVSRAIQRAAGPDGVLVLMDLGSAVLSAELAVELAGEDRPPVVLSEAPIVEGLVAAVVGAAGGGTLTEVAAEAAKAAGIKSGLLGAAPVGAEPEPAPSGPSPSASIEVVLHNAHGLHARPAARLVQTISRFDAEVTLRDVTTGGLPVSGRSISAVSTMGAVAGHHIEIHASGHQAGEALAAVLAVVGRNFDEMAPAPAFVPSSVGPIAASPGIGIGPKCSRERPWPGDAPVPAGTPEDERARLTAAIERTRDELRATRTHVASTTSDHEAAIFDAHLLLLADDELPSAALRFIDDGQGNAEQAWGRAADALARRFDALADPYQRARAADVESVAEQVRAQLAGEGRSVSASLEGVFVATELSPAQAARLDRSRVRAIVTAGDSPVSHGAILARSLGIPMVVAAGDEVLAVADGTTIVVDGDAGEIVIGPAPSVARDYAERAAAASGRAEALWREAARPAHTTDGVHVEVGANVAAAGDIVAALNHGADSVGLLRTEFLYLERREAPSEEEQEATYRAIADALGGRRLTIRTLDVGGDKRVPYLPVGFETSPFLGRRGIRLSLERPDLLGEQLRALLRVGLDNPVTVIFPMVSTIEELRQARALLLAAAEDVGCRRGELPRGFEVGVMVEVPALALHAAAAATLVDVFSIGTNDLTQYVLAAERGNAAVAGLADPCDPAVLRLIAAVTDAAGDRVRVAVCGEFAAEPGAAALLIGLGVRELSMAARAVPAAKHAVRSVTVPDAQALARQALAQDSARAVRALLERPDDTADT